MNDEWIQVKNVKSIKKDQKREERMRWKELGNLYPHIIQPSRAVKIQEAINVDGLAAFLCSNIAIETQKEGWIYSKTLKLGKTAPAEIVDGGSPFRLTLDIGNKWGDKVLFVRLSNDVATIDS